MTWRKELFKNFQPTCPYVIGLPNGSEEVGVEQGSACLGSNLFYVHNILYTYSKIEL